MNTKAKNWILLLLAPILLLACGPTAQIEKAEDVDFSAYKTFYWTEISRDPSGSAVQKRINQQLKDAITRQLEKSGWQQTARKPDLLVSYETVVEKSTTSVNDPVYSRPFTRYIYNPWRRGWVGIYYPSRFLWYENVNVPVTEGTTTISLIDARTEKVVWQGWATTDLNSRQPSQGEIEQSVKAIFKKFDLAKR